eukprot:m51a1_g14191 hypothetical protein (2124) ;mRNA; f:87444-106949
MKRAPAARPPPRGGPAATASAPPSTARPRAASARPPAPSRAAAAPKRAAAAAQPQQRGAAGTAGAARAAAAQAHPQGAAAARAGRPEAAAAPRGGGGAAEAQGPDSSAAARKDPTAPAARPGAYVTQAGGRSSASSASAQGSREGSGGSGGSGGGGGRGDEEGGAEGGGGGGGEGGGEGEGEVAVADAADGGDEEAGARTAAATAAAGGKAQTPRVQQAKQQAAGPGEHASGAATATAAAAKSAAAARQPMARRTTAAPLSARSAAPQAAAAATPASAKTAQPQRLSTTARTSSGGTLGPQRASTAARTSPRELEKPQPLTSGARTSSKTLAQPQRLSTTARSSLSELEKPQKLATAARTSSTGRTSSKELERPQAVAAPARASAKSLERPQRLAAPARSSVKELERPHKLSAAPARTSEPSLSSLRPQRLAAPARSSLRNMAQISPRGKSSAAAAISAALLRKPPSVAAAERLSGGKAAPLAGLRSARPRGPAGARQATSALKQNVANLTKAAAGTRPSEHARAGSALAYLTKVVGPQAAIAEALKNSVAHKTGLGLRVASERDDGIPLKLFIVFRQSANARVVPRRVDMAPCVLSAQLSYVLDDVKAGAIWVLHGAKSNHHCRMAAVAFAGDVRMKQRKGLPQVHVVDLKAADDAAFWSALAVRGADASAMIQDIPNSVQCAEDFPDELYECRLSATGELEFAMVCSGKRMLKSSLASFKSFVLDCWTEVYVWIGRTTQRELRKKLLYEGRGYSVALRKRPKWVEAETVFDGTEPELLKSKFADWGSVPIAVGAAERGATSPRPVLPEFDIKTMLSPALVVERKIEDLPPTGEILELQRVKDDYKVAVAKQEWGQFYEGESYVLLYKYLQGNLDKYITYFWQGRTSKILDKGKAAALTVDVAQRRRIESTQLRVTQGKETAHFLGIFGGFIVVHRGRVPETDPSNTIENQPRLYHCRVCRSGLGTRVVGVPAVESSLDSNDWFVLRTVNTVYVWIGAYCQNHSAEDAVAERLNENGACIVIQVKDGSEPPEMLAALDKCMTGHIQGYQRRRDEWGPGRLFLCSIATGAFRADEAADWACEELEDGHCAILDQLPRAAFVWIGRKAPWSERVRTLRTAVEYAKLRGFEDTSSVLVVNSGAEPAEFIHCFHGWLLHEGATPGNVRLASDVVGELTRKFTLSELQDKTNPLWQIDPTHMEDHLEAAEFIRACEAIARLFAAQRDPAAALAVATSSCLPARATRLLDDGSDSVRERAALLCLALARSCGGDVASECAACACARLAAAREQCEEVRIALARTASATVGCPAVQLDSLRAALCATYSDRFDDVEGLGITRRLAAEEPERARVIGDSLVRSVLGCAEAGDAVTPSMPGLSLLAHRKHAVREAALSAVGSLFTAGCSRYLAAAASQLARLVSADSSQSARRAAVLVARNALCTPALAQEEAAPLLLPTLLAGVADTAPEVSSEAYAALCSAGEAWAQSHEQQLRDVAAYGPDLDVSPAAPAMPPAMQGRRAPLGARSLVQGNLRALFRGLAPLRFVSAAEADRAIGVLWSAVALGEQPAVEFCDDVLGIASRAELAAEMDAHVRARAEACVRLYAWFCGPEACVPRALAACTAAGLSQPGRCSYARVLGAVLRGSDRAQLLGLLPSVASGLASSEEPAAFLCASEAVEDVAGMPQEAYVDFCLVRLAAGAPVPQSVIPATAVRLLRSSSEWLSNLDKRVALFGALMREAGSHQGVWESDAPSTAEAAQLLCSVGSRAESPAEIRALAVSQLHRCIPSSFFPVPCALFEGVVKPNMPWRPGPQWAALRRPEDMQRIAAEAAQMVLQHIDDDDSATRSSACACLERTLACAPAALSGPLVADVCDKLVGRLDDSDDSVRLAAIPVIMEYFKHAVGQSALPAESQERFLSKLLIHMDDTNAAVQNAVFACLAGIASVVPEAVADHATKAMARSSSQTRPPEVIYVALPRRFKRFKTSVNWTDDEIKRLAGDKDIVLLREDDDPGPVAKYLFLARAQARGEVSFERVFVGDDDQRYSRTTLERMVALWPRGFHGYMQNDYHFVRQGTGGFAHGFVGLMLHNSTLVHLLDWPRPDIAFDVDDQNQVIKGLEAARAKLKDKITRN